MSIPKNSHWQLSYSEFPNNSILNILLKEHSIMINLKVAKFDKDEFCKNYETELKERYTEDMKSLKRELALDYLVSIVSLCVGLIVVTPVVFVLVTSLTNTDLETHLRAKIATVVFYLLALAIGGIGLYVGLSGLFSFSSRRDRKQIKKRIADYSSETGIKNYEEEEYKSIKPFDYFLNQVYVKPTDENKMLCVNFSNDAGAARLRVKFVFSLNNEVKSVSEVFSVADRVDMKEPEINLETCSLIIPYGYDKNILFTNEFQLTE